MNFNGVQKLSLQFSKKCAFYFFQLPDFIQTQRRIHEDMVLKLTKQVMIEKVLWHG